ncbi:MAG: hypothetical protein KDB04_16070 [Acidimicrobiales bacterium]|nr:hypothetical protein [Acidimicrobiales bacterium]
MAEDVDGRTAPAPPTGAPLDSALPSPAARALAMAAIVVAGVCGGLIGWKVTDLQVAGDSQLWPGIVGLVGAALAAGGVAVVSVLVLRAMGEWQTIVERGDPAAARRPPRRS